MNNSSKNVLFFTEIDTFPVNGGEKIRSYGLIRLLSEFGFNVVAVTGKYKDNQTNLPLIKNVSINRFDFSTIKSTNRFVNFIKIFAQNKTLISYLDNVIIKNNIEIAFIDYFYYGQYISYFHKKNIKVIYGTHNVQSRLILQRPIKGLKAKFSVVIEYILHRIHEKKYFKQADALIAVSELDKMDYIKFISSQKVFVIPNFLVEDRYNFAKKITQNYLVMTANFYAYQNYAGLEWFVREVWCPEIYKRTKLVIIGWGSKKVLNELKDKNDVTNIEALGEVDDMIPYISNAKASLVPLLHGSGSRLKCLEAMALKTPLISSSKGIEGIDHEGSCLIADTAEDFKQAVINLLNGLNDNSEKAYLIYKKKYSLSSNLDTFKKIMKLIE